QALDQPLNELRNFLRRMHQLVALALKSEHGSLPKRSTRKVAETRRSPGPKQSVAWLRNLVHCRLLVQVALVLSPSLGSLPHAGVGRNRPKQKRGLITSQLLSSLAITTARSCPFSAAAWLVYRSWYRSCAPPKIIVSHSTGAPAFVRRWSKPKN